jgi:hypothetical protein
MDTGGRTPRNDLMGAVVRKHFVGFGWFMGKVTGWSQERGMYMCVPAANPTRSDALTAHDPFARALVVREQRGSRHGQHSARTLPRVCASRASRKLAAPRPFRLRPPLVRRVLA